MTGLSALLRAGIVATALFGAALLPASAQAPSKITIVVFGFPSLGAFMPPVIKAHIVGAFVIIGIIPFTRLMHFLVAPFHYIFRPFQLVMWTWDRKRVRDPKTVWTVHRPKNN